jgi:phosphomannomutase
VRGHIHGKDSAYEPALFVEMISRTGKHPSEMVRESSTPFGEYIMRERNFAFQTERNGMLKNGSMKTMNCRSSG